MNYYLVTIKRVLTDDKDFDHLTSLTDIAIDISKDVNYFSGIVYENDSKVKLHVHLIVGNKKRIYFKKYKKTGYHIHFREFPETDLMRVLNYLEKEDHPLITNHYYHKYSMID